MPPGSRLRAARHQPDRDQEPLRVRLPSARHLRPPGLAVQQRLGEIALSGDCPHAAPGLAAAGGLDVAELMMLVEEGIDILLPRGYLPETVGELLDVANYFSHPDENGVSG